MLLVNSTDVIHPKVTDTDAEISPPEGSKTDDDPVDWERVMSYHPTRNTVRINYMSQHIGKRISCKCKGEWRSGIVSGFCNSNTNNESTWIVTLNSN